MVWLKFIEILLMIINQKALEKTGAIEAEHYVYSIGHGNRSIEAFITLLNQHNISYVIDVRSKPRSRFNPQYNKDKFYAYLKEANIGYVFMGDNLGGLPRDTSCYDEIGRVDYEKVKKKDFFNDGIKRIKTAYDKKIRVACVCSELSACDCHRSKLIGEVLKELYIPMLHIGKKGELENQDTVIKEVLGNIDGIDLFSNGKISLKSRKSYI